MIRTMLYRKASPSRMKVISSPARVRETLRMVRTVVFAVPPEA